MYSKNIEFTGLTIIQLEVDVIWDIQKQDRYSFTSEDTHELFK